MAIRGSCLCGDVAFEVEPPFEFLAHCHCSMCRKTHGTACDAALGVDGRQVRWLRGRAGVRRYESSPGNYRPFCGRCGSSVPIAPPEGRAFVPAGLLDGDPGLRSQAHIFVGSKAPWHAIAGDVPQFEAYPPGYGDPVPFVRPTEPVAGVVRGSCLCGGIAFEIDEPVSGPICNCHCSRCRKGRAAAHASNLFVALPHFRWLRGAERIDEFKLPEAERFTQAFCRTCGSPMPKLYLQRDRAVVPAGSLDDDPGAREEIHIFVGSKAPWYAIVDDLPQHDEYPPGPHPPPPRR